MLEILLNIESKETRCAVMRHGVLHDLIVERRRTRQVVGNIYRGDVATFRLKLDFLLFEIDTTGEHSDRWHDDIVNERLHDATKRTADYDADRHVNHVAFDRKLLEFRQ